MWVHIISLYVFTGRERGKKGERERERGRKRDRKEREGERKKEKERGKERKYVWDLWCLFL